MLLVRRGSVLRRSLCLAPARSHSTVTAPLPSSNELPPPPPATYPRLAQLKSAPVLPFSRFLTDRYSRQHNYLRISVTERCNLRCLYCMPAAGVPLSPPPHLLSTPEIFELASLFVSEGVTKIRLTGGEPTVRKDITELIESLGGLRDQGLRDIAMTSNGVALPERRLRRMVDAGLNALNLSLDTLVPAKFEFMTRRRGLENVLRTIENAGRMFDGGKGTLKVNVVVMKGTNDDEMTDFVEMTRERDVEVRFIEYMPFDGNKWKAAKMLPFAEMVDMIREKHPDFAAIPIQKPNDTAKTFKIPGFRGKIGFITSMTENFCGTCNRLRITGDGNIKVCLFGNEEVSLRDLMRNYRDRDDSIGSSPRNKEMRKALLEVIGAAVGRKEEGHKPAEELVKDTGRPMILIVDNHLSSGTLRPALVPLHLLPRSMGAQLQSQARFYSSGKSLPHLTSTGAARMVSITSKAITNRTATAVGTITFSNPDVVPLIRTNGLKKGDVLAVSRIAGIMAAKRCPELVALAHPILLTCVEVLVELQGSNEVIVEATVHCEGKTGVEMEALTAVTAAALNVVDMTKAVDKHSVIGSIRVVRKSGGRSGDWADEGWVSNRS